MNAKDLSQGIRIARSVKAGQQLSAEGIALTPENIQNRIETLSAKDSLIDPNALTLAQGVQLTQGKTGRPGVVIPPPPPPLPNSDPYPTDEEYPRGGMQPLGGNDGELRRLGSMPPEYGQLGTGLNKEVVLIPGMKALPIWVYILVVVLIIIAWKYGAPKK